MVLHIIYSILLVTYALCYFVFIGPYKLLLSFLNTLCPKVLASLSHYKLKIWVCTPPVLLSLCISFSSISHLLFILLSFVYITITMASLVLSQNSTINSPRKVSDDEKIQLLSRSHHKLWFRRLQFSIFTIFKTDTSGLLRIKLIPFLCTKCNRCTSPNCISSCESEAFQHPFYDEGVLLANVYSADMNVDLLFNNMIGGIFLKDGHNLEVLNDSHWHAAVDILLNQVNSLELLASTSCSLSHVKTEPAWSRLRRPNWTRCRLCWRWSKLGLHSWKRWIHWSTTLAHSRFNVAYSSWIL